MRLLPARRVLAGAAVLAAAAAGGLGLAAADSTTPTTTSVTLSGAATVTTPPLTIGAGFVRPGDVVTTPVTLTGDVTVPTVTVTVTAPATTTTPTPTTTTTPTPTTTPTTTTTPAPGPHAATVACGGNLSAAIQSANAGSTIYLDGACDYGDTKLTARQASPPVNVEAQGAAIGYLDDSMGGLVIRGAKIRGFYIHSPADGVTIDQSTNNGRFFVTGSGVSVTGSVLDGRSVGGGEANGAAQIKRSSQTGPVPQRILFDNDAFTNWQRDAATKAAGTHIDVLHFMDADHVQVTNSTFNVYDVEAVLLQNYQTPAGGVHDYDIEGNTFGPVNDGYYALTVATSSGQVYDGLTIRGNTSASSFTIGSPTASSFPSGATVSGNRTPTGGALHIDGCPAPNVTGC